MSQLFRSGVLQYFGMYHRYHLTRFCGIPATHPISDSPLVTDCIPKHLAVFKAPFCHIGISLCKCLLIYPWGATQNKFDLSFTWEPFKILYKIEVHQW